MSDVFESAAAETMSPTQDAPSQDASTEVSRPDNQAPQINAVDGSPKGDVAMAIAELDKMDKFKLDGQEWTLKDLKAAIMRQKDYTQKTQTLSEERKSFQEERKFHENLAWDLQKVRENPALAQEFVKLYPQKFHRHVDEFLKSNTQAQVQQSQVQQPQVDVQLLSRLQTLENFFNEQQVSRYETQIQQTVDELSKKYPDAGNFIELVKGRAYEAHMQGAKLTNDEWEKIFKDVDGQVKEQLKAKYGSLVKQQTEANSKAKDVGAGGGTQGRAPVKFKKMDDLLKAGEHLLRGDG